jgi:superfamily II DNA helicase RecQ
MAGRVDEVQMAVPTVRQPRSSRRSARSRRGGRRRDSERSGRGVGKTAKPRSSQTASDEETSGKVFEALRAWRLDQARERAVAPFIVMHDRTLAAIATSLPRSIADLGDVPGIGPAKLAAYADAILSVVTSIVMPK